MQGLDYAYTLQGWLKGINPTMGGSLTNGTDTTEAKPVAQDVFGFSLHYYKSDYKAIWYTPQASSVLGALTTNAAPLYNGNIAAMAVNIPKLSNTRVYNYKYDQLNRLVAMDMYNGLNPVAGTFTASGSTEYRERITYDPNGNIGTYQRNGDAARLTMDNLTYSYTPNTNRLHKVVDLATDASAGVYPNYNDLRTGQGNDYYKYDSIGNLIKEGNDSITWNVYGKIESVFLSANTIRYTYDASGNRISKSTTADTTFYVRDASGNVLSVYSKPAGGTIAQEEVHLYGSSRLGITTRHLAPDTSFNAAGDFGKILGVKFTRGEKLFELSNHLGNVLVTIADRVVQVKVTSDTVRHYLADVRSANDYYPFGMLMPGRKFNAGGFRYGFNGQEMSNEIKGVGNSYTAEYWEYDPRLGRRWNVDPIPKFHESPYAAFANNPISFIDPNGADTTLPGGDGRDITLPTGVSGITTFDGTVRNLEGSSVTVQPSSGTLSSFSINGKQFNALFGGHSGKFKGYYSGDLSYSDYSAQQAASYGLQGISVGGAITQVGSGGATGAALPALPLAGFQIGWSYGSTHADKIASWVEAVGGTIGKWVGEKVVPDVGVGVARPPDRSITLYRGVHFDHPDYANALMGIATPWGLNGGHKNPRQHNQGNNFSIFTSWTVSKLTAQMWATSNGPGGLILSKQFSLSEIVPSPDIFREGEMLIPGVVTGATVNKPGQ